MPQSSKHVEQMAPELDRIVSPSELIHDLADGFGGAQGPAEGPLWWKEGRYLLFSDIHNNRRMKYDPGKGVSLFQEPTNRANGLRGERQVHVDALMIHVLDTLAGIGSTSGDGSQCLRLPAASRCSDF